MISGDPAVHEPLLAPNSKQSEGKIFTASCFRNPNDKTGRIPPKLPGQAFPSTRHIGLPIPDAFSPCCAYFQWSLAPLRKERSVPVASNQIAR